MILKKILFPELSIQPSLNSILLPRHITDQTVAPSVTVNQAENSTVQGDSGAPMSETTNTAEQSTSNMA